MTGRSRLPLLGALALALATGTLPLTGAAGATGADRPDPATTARRHLADDASGAVQVVGGPSGAVRFVGTRRGDEVDNPDVPRGASVSGAARAHLDRYGAMLGATGDTTYVQRSARHTVSGLDVVRYAQEVDGVPVIGGDAVVTMAPDRGLRSLLSTVSAVGTVRPATVDQAEAARTARAAVARATRIAGLRVTGAGRWLLDPAVVPVDPSAGPSSVWRFEVGDGAAVRQLVLVDDHTGQVLLSTDLVERADPDRVVCDRSNVRGSETACTSGFARAEGDPATGNTDVDDAYDLSGAVSDFYRDVAGVSLTQLLGVPDANGVPRLASTVRFCTTSSADGCPYDNAFWNGQQMFYGAGWAGADDVVGHEMTHGFVDQYSKLFYWGQSGAINESMADVIGEIIDHRRGSDDDSAWLLGEDSPAQAIRSLQYPGQFQQPDKMTSGYYTDDAGYQDNGGVHTNSGVGNKTAYLISQGGSFNGQTITGIDAGDPSLSKTATLYVDVIERLSSGADYAALAQQLDQSCQDLAAAGTAGFVAADCTAVHQAGLATELRSNPPAAPHATDASTSCPVGSSKRVLLDSEADNGAAFAPVGTGWSRVSAAGTSNATSDGVSWYVKDPGSSTVSTSWIATRSLRAAAPVAVPAGQQTFMSFQNWYLFDYDPNGYYDGGTVELGVDGAVPALGSTDTATWVNGPSRTLATGYGNTGGGHPAYGGDSHGWSVSRLDLTAYRGHTVTPQFTMRSDDQWGSTGWYLDDITIYTCDGSSVPPPPPPPAVPSAPQAVSVHGSMDAMTVSWSAPAANPGAVTAYQVTVAGVAARTVPASARSLTIGGLPAGSPAYSVSVQALGSGGAAAAAASLTVARGYPSARARRHGARLAVRGSVHASGASVAGLSVQVQRQTASGWRTVRTVVTRSDGSFTTAVRRPGRAYYRVVFTGSPGVVGTASARHRW